MIPYLIMSASSQQRRRHKDFENAKLQALGKTKRDKSSAGRIDARAVEICAAINFRDDMYTTSSCSGRCFFYTGQGIKATSTFTRFRVNHDVIRDARRYFDLATLVDDPSGGGDIIPTIGQYDYKQQQNDDQQDNNPDDDDDHTEFTHTVEDLSSSTSIDVSTATIWFRYEPFILHVACRSLSAAEALMAAARPAFKNVGITSLSKHGSKIIVAIWGDEGLELPYVKDGTCLYESLELQEWLSQLSNERAERNWSKIKRFVQAVNEMKNSSELDEELFEYLDDTSSPSSAKIGSFDVIGDVAYLHNMPADNDPKQVGEAIMKKNKAIKVVVARTDTMQGSERAPMESLKIIAGMQRSPLMTSAREFGISAVVNLEHCFFTPRMAQERLRICQQVARGEHILVLFAGVHMEAFQLAAKTEASSITTIELNPVAIQCAQRGKQLLERNSSLKNPKEKADKIQILEGDALELLPTLPLNHYHRVLCPRPKEGETDSDLSNTAGGRKFLEAMLPHLRDDGGEVHWYDFIADHEYPTVERTKRLLEEVGDQNGLSVEVLNVANVGSVAMRQLRACIDFKVFKKT
jgi:tRNA G37 N-methylase Trm5